MARLNADGSRDTTFNLGGAGATGTVSEIIVQSDGKILIGGAFGSWNGVSRWYVARLNPDGILDTSFVVGTAANLYLYSMALQSDGKILIGGAFSTYNGTGRGGVARLNSNGSLDPSFTTGAGIPHVSQSSVDSIAVQTDGKIVIAGEFTSYDGVARRDIARLNPDGTLDTGFLASGAGPGNRLHQAIVLSSGKIFIGGEFTTYNDTPRGYVAWLWN